MAKNRDISQRAKTLLGSSTYIQKSLGTESSRKYLGDAGNRVHPAQGLDVYVLFDTTGSMRSYITIVRENVDIVNSSLLDGKNDIRISINGVGDHCDGDNCLQMYALSNDPVEIRSALEKIVMTNGGDEPEMYECAALALAQRLLVESPNRKCAVVLIGDSYPHGIRDALCERGVDYHQAFTAMKILTDSFYFVGCAQRNYSIQRELVKDNGREYFIPLGNMIDVLPELLVALVRKTESPSALADYLKLLETGQASKIHGLLGNK
ncbi:VWA domain-containing protein [Candidatus Woesearchaeota archaeon]|nr:VWA domain-containing protein [Candidatus Woesearchaeota archaeon]